MNSTVTNIQAAIGRLERHRGDFHEALTDRLEASSQLHLDDQLALKKARLNHSQISILSIVNTAGEMPYKQLTEKVAFSQGMVSRYVNKLIKLNLLKKVNLPDNKKAYHLAITESGAVAAELHDQLHEEENARFSDALAGFSPRELRTTLQVLEAMADVVDSPDQEA